VAQEVREFTNTEWLAVYSRRTAPCSDAGMINDLDPK